ncbi:MAG: hypothetical protein BV457_09455 [Thermoplasmata archaeon M9B1D]|nr:MAG: hypothetical protein BV457_09455 [Thermoplasmata archaeon M9B1D]PNX49559.1 MAG: hypothetical protein BV456_08865 [Thermoplasmata archaeon M8B2D]
MITKAIPIDTKNSTYLYWDTGSDNSINFGSPSTPYYIYNSRHDLTHVDSILLVLRAGKSTDLDADNTIKLIIGSTTVKTKTFTSGVLDTKDYVDVSSYAGMHNVKLYVEGGTDNQLIRRCLMVALGS